METEVEAGVRAERLREFTSGRPIPVPVARIEAELSTLWRSVWAQCGQAVTRACLWTLVVRVPAEALARARRLVAALTPSVPARVIVIATRSGPSATLEATVEANWHSTSGGATQIGSEAITLIAGGAVIGDVPPIVRALLLPDVPTAALWLGAPPVWESALDRELRAAGERLILDGDGAAAGARPGAGLVALARFLASGEGGDVADLAWLRGAPVRSRLATLFDPPAPTGAAFGITRARLTFRPDRTATALLLLGWLSTRLKWSEGRTGAGAETLRFRNARGAAVTVTLHKDARAKDPIGSVELYTGEGRYAVTCSVGSAMLETPVLAWKEPLPPVGEADPWVRALGPAGRDPLYIDALDEIASVVRGL